MSDRLALPMLCAAHGSIMIRFARLHDRAYDMLGNRRGRLHDFETVAQAMIPLGRPGYRIGAQASCARSTARRTLVGVADTSGPRAW